MYWDHPFIKIPELYQFIWILKINENYVMTKKFKVKQRWEVKRLKDLSNILKNVHNSLDIIEKFKN